MNPRNQALLARAILGLVLVELPVLTIWLSQPVFDYRLLAIGLLGAAAGFLEKLLVPQLADTYLAPRSNSPEPLTTVLTMPPTRPPVVPPAGVGMSSGIRDGSLLPSPTLPAPSVGIRTGTPAGPLPPH